MRNRKPHAKTSGMHTRANAPSELTALTLEHHWPGALKTQGNDLPTPATSMALPAPAAPSPDCCSASHLGANEQNPNSVVVVTLETRRRSYWWLVDALKGWSEACYTGQSFTVRGALDPNVEGVTVGKPEFCHPSPFLGLIWLNFCGCLPVWRTQNEIQISL